MRIIVEPPFGIGDSHLPQQLHGAVGGFPPRGLGMLPDRLDELVTDGQDRIERGHRVLEDHRDVLAPHPLHLALGQGRQIPAHETNPTADNPCGRLGQETHDCQCSQ